MSSEIAAVAPADILADLRCARDVEALHRLGARAVLEFLVELGRERLLRTDLEQRVRRWARLDRAMLEAAGGERVVPMPLWLINRAER
jgi:hypothetical protein